MKKKKIPDFTSADLNTIGPYAGLEDTCTRVGGLSGLVGSQVFKFYVYLPARALTEMSDLLFLTTKRMLATISALGRRPV